MIKKGPAFGKRLRDFRKKSLNPKTGLPYTQEAIAKKIGIRANYYNRLEKHGLDPQLSTMLKICTAFGCSLDDIILGRGE